MILDKTVKIRGNGRNITRFKNLGYDIEVGEYVDILIEHLSENTHFNVNVKCDICGDEYVISYYSYTRNIKSYGYYSCSKCSIEKNKKTNLKKFGVEYPTQNKEIILKRKENNIEKYGVDEPSKLEEYIQKGKDTKLKKYGDCGYNNNRQSKETKKEKYGDENYNNREKAKETCLENYGVENVSQKEDIKNKKIKTCLENYGVENPSQNFGIFEKAQKSSKTRKTHENGLGYQGTYENDFINFCIKNNIKIEKPKTVRFILKNKNKCYHPDFFIEKLNLIIEIKSTYFYELHKDLCDIKKKETLKQNYNYIMILNKNYDIFLKTIKILSVWSRFK